jgi:hypothetical protein
MATKLADIQIAHPRVVWLVGVLVDFSLVQIDTGFEASFVFAWVHGSVWRDAGRDSDGQLEE